MIVSNDGISEVQEMTAAKLIEIIETLESVTETRDWMSSTKEPTIARDRPHFEAYRASRPVEVLLMRLRPRLF